MTITSIPLDMTFDRSIHDLVVHGRHQESFPLADVEKLDRVPFFHPSGWPEPGIGRCGARMTDPQARRYHSEPVVAYEFPDAYVLGADGIVMLDGRAVMDTLAAVPSWPDASNFKEIHHAGFLRLRRPLPVTHIVKDARYVVGYNGAWRNHEHWLRQCLPRLYAFTLLRRFHKDIKIALPALSAGSVQARTVQLIGIEPEEVYTVPADEAVCFASVILMLNVEISRPGSFVSAAADAVAAGVTPANFDERALPQKVYIRRKVSGRRLTNFDTLTPILDRYGFQVRSFEDMDLADQIATMRSARYVISEHGAGSANILFCRCGGAMLELFNPVNVEPGSWSIASLRGLEFGYMIGKHVPTEPAMLPERDSAYEISPEKFEVAIRTTLAALPAPRIGDPVTDAEQSPAPFGFWMLVHVQQNGDTLADPQQWAGVRGSGLAIEGLELRPLPELSRHDIRYRALRADQTWSEWVFAGAFCGSRGLSQSLLGYEVQLQGAARRRFDLSCSARFVDGTEVHSAADGVGITAHGAPLEAIQILVSERMKPPSDKAGDDKRQRHQEQTLTKLSIANTGAESACKHEWHTQTTHLICLKCNTIERVLPDFLVYD